MTTVRRSFLVGIAGILAGLMGCGGAVDTDLYGDPIATGSDAGKDTSTGPDGNTSDDGDVPPVTDASVGDGPMIVDATPIFDVTPIVDSGPSDPGTLCFTQYNPPVATYCKNGTDLCCIKQQASACMPQSQALNCQQGTRLSCDDSTSCGAGKVCCGSLNSLGGNNYYYSEATCTSTCAVSTQVPGLRRFCNPNAIVDECLSIGLTCGASNVLSGYYVCS